VLRTDQDLSAGQVMRIRVEPADDVDAMIVVAMSPATAEQWVSWARANLPDVFSESQTDDEIHDFFFSAGSDVWNSGDGHDAVAGMDVLTIDTAYEGEVEAMYLPVVADGSYRVIVGSYGGDGDARAIVQVWDDTVDPVADAEAIYWQEDFDDEFFTETAFYDDSAPYTP
jgi:hypothetical protein